MDYLCVNNKIIRLQTAVKEQFLTGVRFAQWLGLEKEGLMKYYGLDQTNYWRMAKYYNNVTKPLLLKNQEKARANLFVSSLRTGAEFREGTTPYDVMLENNVNQAFNVVIADYNQEMDANDQLNQSLMLEAKAAGQEYAGRMTARSQYFAAAGSLLSDANKLGYV